MNDYTGRYKSAGWMLDQWECECGWVSETYFDGYVYAREEWERHIENDYCGFARNC